MAQSFFFYDLETSGLSPRYDRVMQFAGQRTDMNLKPIGEPVNLLVKLPEDILPSPEALLVTGITPQKTASEGISEPEFARTLIEEIFTPNTIAIGFNNIRFDDEFIRHILWRNFYDPYQWAYDDGRSRWDLLDVSRLVRALRPDGIKWPMDAKGKPSNRLELLSSANKLAHTKAHDALSDVEALIAMTKLIRDKQPKMFDYLFSMRGKNDVAKLVNLENPQPFVYASGRYGSEYEKTTVAFPIAPGSKPNSVLVYDLRSNIVDFPPNFFSSPTSSSDLSRVASPSSINRVGTLPLGQLHRSSSVVDDSKKSSEKSTTCDRFVWPVKELAYNRCPAVAPLGVLDDKSWRRIGLDLKTVEANLEKLQKNRGAVDKIVAAWNDRPDWPAADDVEGQLYDSFTPDADKSKIMAVRSISPGDLADFHPNFIDERLAELLFRYKARNFPQSMSESEQGRWDKYRTAKFERELPGYMNRLAQLATERNDHDDQFILEEIQLWVESMVP